MYVHLDRAVCVSESDNKLQLQMQDAAERVHVCTNCKEYIFEKGMTVVGGQF